MYLSSYLLRGLLTCPFRMGRTYACPLLDRRQGHTKARYLANAFESKCLVVHLVGCCHCPNAIPYAEALNKS